MCLIPKKIVCPNCIQEITKKDIVRRCEKCGKSDTIIVTGKPWQRVYRCQNPPECRNQITKLYCGKCDAELPSDIMDFNKCIRFSLIGTQGSGKSIFLTTLLNEFYYAQDMRFSLESMNDDTEVWVQTNCEELFRNKTTLPATNPGEPPTPLQLRIKDTTKKGKIRKTIASGSMTVFDGAGENSRRPSGAASRNIAGAKTLILLFDPLVLTGVSEKVDKDILNWSTTADINEMDPVFLVNQVAAYIKKNLGLKASDIIDRDVAVVFTKIDTIRDEFRDAAVMRSSPHLAAQSFVTADADAVDAEIRDWLIKNNQHAFLKALSANFNEKKIRFFGVSSLGNPPTGDKKLGIIRPHRVLDPLMWMLYKEKIIKGE